ncbi:helix-turn-helix transcriptional regulator [Paenibacillus sp. BK720]|uniref:helix-turn-helix transcriptional regulator n=1 Tax=Paenibacillus sp. BK720 TaxID=2587092 RepID=UPI00141F5C97|nr:helix-turn-helix transcriptional regulator [Paenibacillus sp. BK720]NIK68774.1 DNA-binding XRE family transcriptional regulator [Paenibacillus sp. BK720]
MTIKVKDLSSLNKLIIMKGYSKTDFSKEIGMSQPVTIQITKGQRNPSPKTAKRISEVLECGWEEIFEIVEG